MKNKRKRKKNHCLHVVRERNKKMMALYAFWQQICKVKNLVEHSNFVETHFVDSFI